MSKSRVVFLLCLASALLAVTSLGVALWASVRSFQWSSPTAAALLRACQDFAVSAGSLLSTILLTLGVGALTVLALGTRSAVRQLRGTRRYLARLDLRGPVPGGPSRTYLFADPAPRAFTAGLLRPRVFVSTGAAAALAGPELCAVLSHESHHARRRDPLRLLVMRSVGDAFSFLPGIRRLTERYAALAEVAADAAAVRMTGGDRRPLAAALVTFHDASPPAAVVGIAAERVDTLLGERLSWLLPARSLAWAVASLAAASVVALGIGAAADPVSLPLLIAGICMPLMTLAPPILLGLALLAWASRRPDQAGTHITGIGKSRP